MVAYNFDPRFADAIRDGQKRQTVRRWHEHHAKPGDRLQLFTGLRTPQARKLLAVDPACITVLECTLRFDQARIARIEVGGVPVRNLNGFAVLDGFRDLAEMNVFWREKHPDAVAKGLFKGVVIEWASGAVRSVWPVGEAAAA